MSRAARSSSVFASAVVKLEIAVALAPVTANRPVFATGSPTFSLRNVCICAVSRPANSKSRRMPEPSSPTDPSTVAMLASPSCINAYNPVATPSLSSADFPISLRTSFCSVFDIETSKAFSRLSNRSKFESVSSASFLTCPSSVSPSK